jgi:hypothetical protein
MAQKFEKWMTLIFVLLILMGACIAYLAYDYSRDAEQLIERVVEKEMELEARISKLEAKAGIRR